MAGVEPLLGDLIEAGLDAINPVQVTCNGMDPAHLKSTYGDRLTFWGGGCDTRHILGHGSPDEVRENVRGLVSTLAPGGGFVFRAGSQTCWRTCRLENVVAMLDGAREWDLPTPRPIHPSRLRRPSGTEAGALPPLAITLGFLASGFLGVDAFELDVELPVVAVVKNKGHGPHPTGNGTSPIRTSSVKAEASSS